MIALNRRRVMKMESGGFPSGYTRLSYVSTQGAAYFSTGISVTGDMTFDVNFYLYSACTSSNFTLFGGGQNPSQTRNSVGLVSRAANDIQYIYKIGSWGTTLVIETWYNVEMKDDGFYINGNLGKSITRTSFTGTDKFYIGTNSFRLAYGAFMYIGECKVNNYVYIPAIKNEDNTVGFLCMNDNTFHTSASGTPFLAGSIYV